MKMSFSQLIARLNWISEQPKQAQKFFMSHINDRGFWQLVKFHTMNLN